ncbi:transcription factor [Diaporthe amygdali]|uniref:transcription factor n=1 Tax=Phomopsis amygdali TaxID=1214568 RepID=UPI0022FE375C|nr:transcription factor [Diaporthe amygdali]KAJ0124485.1 transcription factor [Diaporthe amygdali]
MSKSLDRDVFYNTITTSNGQSLLRSLLSEPIRCVSRTSKPNDHRALLDELPNETQAALPSRDGAVRLTDAYFEHCEFFSPIISSKHDFSSSIVLLYNEGPNGQTTLSGRSGVSPTMFRAYIVFATAVLLLNRTDSAFPISRADNYFATAIQLLAQNPAVICTGDPGHLCNLLLVAQYCCFASNLSGAWHFVGVASRLAVELGLHDERAVVTKLSQDEISQRRWLFWALYTLERNLCVIVGRPFSIPDEAIHTPLPDLAEADGSRALALHLIKHRRLESEIYTTLNQKPPVNGAVIDLLTWREGMRRRVIEWSNSAPTTTAPSTQLAPTDIFSSILHIDLVLLYYPSASFPDPSENDILIVAQSASECISNYRRAFRDGQLRFFWRTTHNLFRSGVATAYCVHLNSMHHYPDLNQADMIASINTCMSVLWAMVERYPPGSVYRDAFEVLSNSVLRSASNVGSLGDVQHQGTSQIAFEQPFWADMALPQTSLGALYWGFGNVPWS